MITLKMLIIKTKHVISCEIYRLVPVKSVFL